MPPRDKPDLLIRIKKGKDGSAALSCTRADGSVTWQKQAGAYGSVFPQHDLTHYAIETELGYRSGFYGLVADGWEISDFTTPWPRGPIPNEAREVELIVGFFDTERRSMDHWTPEEFNDHAVRHVSAGKYANVLTPPQLTDEQITRVRQARDALLARWFEVAPGDALELEFLRT